MLTCSVCGHGNDDLATICSSCRSYVQAKVDGLNLFQTIWGLMETPGSTFKRIVLSRVKNYIFLLSSLLGVSLVFALARYKNMGKVFAGSAILGGGFVAGPLVGIVYAAAVSLLLIVISKLLGGKGTFRNMFSVVSYSAVPMILALFFIFPIELAIFGQFFFDNNPPPLVINPALYIALLGFDLSAACWSCFLLWKGSTIAVGLAGGKGLLLALGFVAVMGLTVFVLRYT